MDWFPQPKEWARPKEGGSLEPTLLSWQERVWEIQAPTQHRGSDLSGQTAYAVGYGNLHLSGREPRVAREAVRCRGGRSNGDTGPSDARPVGQRFRENVPVGPGKSCEDDERSVLVRRSNPAPWNAIESSRLGRLRHQPPA